MIVPQEYVTTREALMNLLDSAASAEWQPKVKSDGYGLALSPEEITAAQADNSRIAATIAKIIAALQSQDLVAVAMVRRHSGWEPHTALWTGELDGIGLGSKDRWLDGKTLCFRREEWRAWNGVPVTAPEGNTPIGQGAIEKPGREKPAD